MDNRKHTAAVAATVLMAVALPMPATAQDAGHDDDTAHRYRIALGPAAGPAYPGADSLSLGPYIDLDRAKGTDYFAHESPDEAFSIPVISMDGFHFGPSIGLVGKRKVKDTAPGMREVKLSVELGLAAQMEFSDRIYGFAEMRKAVSGHDGWVGRAGVDYVLRDGDNWLISAGPRIKWADAKQHDAYFGVSDTEANATGLSPYAPGSGIQAVGATLGADVALGGPWGLAGFVAYERLVGDAADSPVTAAFGSKNQIGGGIGISYSFTRR